MKKLIIVTLITTIFTTFFLPHNSFAIFEQSFSLPIEGGSIYAKMVNSYFKEFVSNSLYQSLLKAGFLLMFFLAIFKFGFNFSAPWKGFLVYVMGFLLLVMPLPGAGKSLPVVLLDSLDDLTNSIIIKLGHSPTFAGQGIMLTTMNEYAKNYAYARNAYWAGKDGLQYCYEKYKQKKMREGGEVKSISAMTESDWAEAGNSNVPSQEEYTRVDKGSYISCNELYKKTVAFLRDNYVEGVDRYIEQAQKVGVPINSADGNRKTLSQYAAELKNSINNSNINQFLEGAMSYARQHPEAEAQSGRTVGLWDVVKGVWNSLITSSGLQSLIMLVPRLLIASAGVSALWFFDYYVYHIGIVIKTLAALGIAIGLLYYAFLGRFDMLLLGTGAWMWANGTYILSSMLMSNFWDRVDGQIGSIVLFVLGQPGPLTDALFMLGMSLAFYSALTGILTWRGVGLSLKLPGAADTLIAPALGKLIFRK
jgi:hypothetical protein